MAGAICLVTGLDGNCSVSAHLAEVLATGHAPRTPRLAGIRAKKKGLETIQALGIGGGGDHHIVLIYNVFPG